jgi:Domain of unknown function (DUF4349)
MAATATRPSWPKRILISIVGLFVLTLIFIVAVRIAVQQMYDGGGIESSSRIPFTSRPAWDVRAMWATAPMLQKSGLSGGVPWESSIARTASLLARSSAFDASLARLNQVVSAHQGFLEDLRTQSQSGSGRVLAATLSVPSKEFDPTVADLKTLGRVEAISEAGEDSAVKLATAERHLAAAQTNLRRLQKLQRERKGELRDAVALEKDIAQASETAGEAQRQHENLLSTVAQAHIQLLLMEDYRTPFQANLPGSSLALRNSFVEGVGAIFSSLALVLGVLFEFGLPLLFWALILFWPLRLVWRRFRHITPNSALPAAP